MTLFGSTVTSNESCLILTTVVKKIPSLSYLFLSKYGERVMGVYYKKNRREKNVTF
jgi:hypothetical protein